MTTESIAQAALCREFVEGCDQCAAESAYRMSQGHDCGVPYSVLASTCDMFGAMKRNSEEFHVYSHEPITCEDCGILLNDRVSPSREKIRLCRSKLCHEWYCPDCGATQASEGPVDCPSCGSLRVYRRRTKIRLAYRRRRRYW